MHDLILLRCTHCRATARLVVYEQSHAYIPADLPAAFPAWLAEHVAHHPCVAECAYDLGDIPGFEVITLGQIQDERDAMDRATPPAT